MNNNKQIYTVRNCEFEPAYGGNIDIICSKCCQEIDYAIQRNIPAIVSTHRLNYIDRINPGNREKSLYGLKKIMDYVVKKYPDIVFMSSDELGDFILERNEKKQ